jgi:hypothetical protein
MGKYEKNPAPQDEWMDEELLALGVPFTDRTGETPENATDEETTRTDAAAPAKPRKLGRMMRNLCGLVAADGLLIFMCLADKIELSYGLVFLAAASAILGGRVNHARL